jgi:uncharacterized protein (DUF111 family)
MTIAYFDCFSGIAGDMVLGALIDLGVGESFLKKELKKLSLTGYNIEVKKVECNHIAATDVTVVVTEDQHHRSLSDIIDILKRSRLDEKVKKRSQTIFTNLGKAEAKIHRVVLKDVHFHEVGAVDSIIDIVGSVIGIAALGIENIYCSATMGSFRCLPLRLLSCSKEFLCIPSTGIKRRSPRPVQQSYRRSLISSGKCRR